MPEKICLHQSGERLYEPGAWAYDAGMSIREGIRQAIRTVTTVIVLPYVFLWHAVTDRTTPSL